MNKKSNISEIFILLVSYCILIASVSKIQVGGVYANPTSSTDSFVNFTLTGNSEITQNTNLIMDYSEQAYYKISNYFLNLDLMKQQEPVFLCLCVAEDCRQESLKWTFNSLVELSKQTRGQNVQTQLKNNPILCNFENYYHTSTEKELFINMDKQIADLYQSNQHLGIIVRSQTNKPGTYILNLLQKRNFCRRCQNILSCDNINCSCSCQVGYMGQYCTESALIFKLGQGSDDLITNSYQLEEKVFIKRIQLSPVQSSSRLRRLNGGTSVNNPGSVSIIEDTSLDSNILFTSQKSIQYIQLSVQPLTESLQQNSTETYSNFYFNFKKDKNDKFKLYIADKFQINSSYISQNDFVKEIDFSAADSEIYIQAYTYNKEYSEETILKNISLDQQENGEQTNIVQVYKIMLKHQATLSQDYLFLVVNECLSTDHSCTNELEIQYSLRDFKNTVESAEGASRVYLIAFLVVTVLGVAIFCSYIIYKNVQKSRNLAALAAAREKKSQVSSEIQFQKIREKVDAELDEEMHKIRNQTQILDNDQKVNNPQLQNGYSSEQASNNRMLDIKNTSNQKQTNILKDRQSGIQVNRFHQANIMKLQKQGIEGQGGRSQNRINSLQDTKTKVKQLYNNTGDQDKKLSKIKLLNDQQAMQVKKSNSLNANQLNKIKKQQSDLKIENITTAHTLNNLIANNSNNLHELSSNNTTTRYNSNNENGMNNIIYLNKENSNIHNYNLGSDQNVSKQLSVPSEASHGLPSSNNNNARPLSHYEFKKDEIDPTTQTNYNNQRKVSNGYGQLTMNYITTNASNTINQLHSNQDFENQSPLEDLIQGQKIGTLIKQEEKKYQKQITTKSLKKFSKSPSYINPSLKKNISKTTSGTNTQSNLNESYSEEDLSSQKKEKNNKLLSKQSELKNPNNQIGIIEINKQEANKSRGSSGEFNLSQQINIICDGYVSDLKGIDGSKIQNHRRNILMMGNQEEHQTGDIQLCKNSNEQNDLQSICQQEISNIMECRKNEMELTSENGRIEDLERGIRLSAIQMGSEREENNLNEQQIQIDDIKIETPEIFFQNCPKCQSKQHEFQLKLSTIGPDGVRPTDKYCQVCLMKAELSEVKLADSF